MTSYSRQGRLNKTKKVTKQKIQLIKHCKASQKLSLETIQSSKFPWYSAKATEIVKLDEKKKTILDTVTFHIHRQEKKLCM